ncbi:MAG: SDR family oxidoreductase [Burkholderiales bacterium]|nr:SDR family oxidoreductase [Burkholderiales bacterium]
MQKTSSMPSVLITGCLGGIGLALVHEFSQNGYYVIGLDKAEQLPSNATAVDAYISCDLNKIAVDVTCLSELLTKLKSLTKNKLDVLINNAAYQAVKKIEDITHIDWQLTQNINVHAPFLLTQGLLHELESAQGSVINIASIHASLTKSEFIAYATSKAALIGMSRAMAVELGSRVRVNAISPAAIATPMLEEGFDGRPEARQQLNEMHPVGRIGMASEVARTCLLLANMELGFLTGANIALDGGIGARLHDPV